MKAPGWYPSPSNPDVEQFWTGSDWSPVVRPGQVIHDPMETFIYGEQLASPMNFNIKPALALRILAVLLLISGAIPTLITLPVLVPSIFGQTIHATGTIVDIDYKTSSTGKQSSSCAAIAAFTVDGDIYRAKSAGHTSPCDWKIGQSANVSYDPANPSSGTVGQSATGTAVLWLFFIVGVGMTATSVWLLVKSFRVSK